MAAQQANMEEILSSIRTTLEEETSRVGAGDADDVLMLEEELTDEQLLALSGEAAAPVPETEQFIDLSAFTNSGQMQVQGKPTETHANDVLGVHLGEPVAAPAPAPVEEAEAEAEVMDIAAPDVPEPVAAPVEDMAVETVPEPEPEIASPAMNPADEDAFDKLLNEIKQEQSVSHADRVESLLGDEPVEDTEVETSEEADAFDASEEMPPVATQTSSQRMELAAIAGPSGLQVALPSEVLAEALRPLITQWLSENLGQVVERLVREEISKLNQQ